MAAFRNRQIGFVFQDHYLLPQCSVLENVLLPAVAAGPVRPETVKRAEMLLDRVGLGERLDHRPAELSGGERQRAALARALDPSPALLLADEPTGNLDRTTADGVGRLLLELQSARADDLDRRHPQPAAGGDDGPAVGVERGRLREREAMSDNFYKQPECAAMRRYAAFQAPSPLRP